MEQSETNRQKSCLFRKKDGKIRKIWKNPKKIEQKSCHLRNNLDFLVIAASVLETAVELWDRGQWNCGAGRPGIARMTALMVANGG